MVGDCPIDERESAEQVESGQMMSRTLESRLIFRLLSAVFAIIFGLVFLGSGVRLFAAFGLVIAGSGWMIFLCCVVRDLPGFKSIEAREREDNR